MVVRFLGNDKGVCSWGCYFDGLENKVILSELISICEWVRVPTNF